MADEAGVMFTADQKATPLLIARWRGKGALIGLPPSDALLESDLSAKRWFRGVWSAAFPDRRGLPFGPLATDEGKFTNAMLNVWT